MTATVMCLVMALWPVVAFLGGAAFPPLTGVAALLTAGAALPRLRPRIYAFTILAFFVFAAGSTLWSPYQTSLIDISNGVAVSEVPRVAFLMLAAGALIAAAQGLSEHAARLIMRIAMIGFIVQVASLVALTIFEREAIAFFYPGRPDDEGVQNISRNCLIMAAAFPFLALGLLESRNRFDGLAAVVLLLAAECAVLLYRGVHTGLLMLLAAAAFYAVVKLFPRQGFRIIGGIIVAIVMSAPFVFRFVSAGVDPATVADSMTYRQLIWDRVIDIIWQNPMFGDGVGALRSYRETIPEGPLAGQLHIPNHAHNMTLQLWAETGLVGATLLSVAIMLVAFRLPKPEQLGPTAPRMAMLAGAVLAVGVVSFDLWNAAWWGVVSILAVLCVAHLRTRADGGSGPVHRGRPPRTISM